MKHFADLLIVLITILIIGLHFYFLVLEMFFWTKPLGLKVFKRTQQQANDSAALAANQGLYNGFLAAGLIWALLTQDAAQARTIEIFFLSCVAAAGLMGGLTANRKILVVQMAPALLALAILLLF